MNFKDLMPKEKEVYIWVKETKMGIETYSNENIKDLPKPIKTQIKAFLQEIIKGV